MQVDHNVNNENAHVDEEDEGSLFGSPPPSPARGRSPSPALALPSSSIAAQGNNANTQNVGIIALPGSQHRSELPINPLALSMSYNYPGNGLAHCPLAPSQPTAAFRSSSGGAVASSSACTPSMSQASSRSTSRAPSIPPVRKKKSKSGTSSPRPPPLQIPLPNPLEPLPPNWLRSQSGLLGYAGVVGGVNTATLSLRHTQGTSSSNPIVIDDDKVNNTGPLSIPPPQDPFPSTKEIVQILIKQKEVFVVLQDILKLQAKGSPKNSSVVATPSSESTSFAQISRTPEIAPFSARPIASNGDEPPKKKRKMDGVPAGATDWDVPFPFFQGDAPQEYYSNWERDRQKQLIGQLVALIKAATRKAALRKRLQEQEEVKKRKAEMEHSQPKVLAHYKPTTVRYGKQVLTDPSNESTTTPTSVIPGNVATSAIFTTSTTTPADAPSFDQLISDLLATVPNGPQPDATGVSIMEPPSIAPSSHDPTPELDDGFMNLWSSIFDSLPMESSFTSLGDSLLDQDPSLQPIIPSSTISVNTSFPEPLPVQFTSTSDSSPSGDIQSDLLLQQSFVDPTVSASTAPSTSISEHQLSHFLSSDSSATLVSESMIDPELLALSRPTITLPIHPNHSQSNPYAQPSHVGDIQTPLTCGSPMPSMSSTSSAGDFTDLPMTPRSALGDVMLPTIVDSSHYDSNMYEGAESGLITAVGGMALAVGRPEGRMADNAQGQGEGDNDKDKDTEAQTALNEILPALLSKVMQQPSEVKGAKKGASSTAKSMKSKKIDKKQLLKRAKERRRLLAEEMIKTRMQLWETTIEHGVLMNIAKYSSNPTQ